MRSPHNHKRCPSCVAVIGARATACEPCLAKRREEAVAKAGARDDRTIRSGGDIRLADVFGDWNSQTLRDAQKQQQGGGLAEWAQANPQYTNAQQALLSQSFATNQQQAAIKPCARCGVGNCPGCGERMQIGGMTIVSDGRVPKSVGGYILPSPETWTLPPNSAFKDGETVPYSFHVERLPDSPSVTRAEQLRCASPTPTPSLAEQRRRVEMVADWVASGFVSAEYANELLKPPQPGERPESSLRAYVHARYR